MAPNGGTTYFSLEEKIDAAISCQDVINKSVTSTTSGANIDATFKPNFSYSLKQAAKACGFVNFDWVQTITHLADPSPYYARNTGSAFKAGVVGQVQLTSASVPFNDPPQGGGYSYQGTPDNSYPYYYDAFSGELTSHETGGIILTFHDAPADPCKPGGGGANKPQCGSTVQPAGSYTGFTTHLAGVNSNGSPTDLAIGFTWTSDFNGTAGGATLAKTDLPADVGSGTGGTGITSVTDTTTYQYVDPSVQVIQVQAVNGAAPGTAVPQVAVTPPLQITNALTFNTVPLGGAVNAVLTASGGTPPYTWSAPGAPSDLKVSGAGQVTGTPTQAGLYRFVVTVNDQSSSTSVYVAFQVMAITTTSLADASAGVSYSATVAATGGVAPLTFSGSGFPAGISISSTGVISGSSTQQGTYKLNIQVSDSTGVTFTAPLSLKVGAPPVLVVQAATLAPGAVGVPYRQSLSASGGLAPYSWNTDPAAVPPGLAATGSGYVFGVPTAPGTYTFDAAATDSLKANATGKMTIVIAPAAIVLKAPAALPAGIVGADYPAQAFVASGGVPPFKYALSSGSLPAGLSLNATGVVGGVPTATGTFPFTVGATDSTGAGATASASVVVRPSATDLLLSTGGLAYTLAVGTVQAPALPAVQVLSSSSAAALGYTAVVSPAVPWLTVNVKGNQTPGSFTVALTDAALSLAASPAPYQTSVLVTCTTPSPCAGSVQTLPVSVTVAVLPPQLTVSATSLTLNTTILAAPVTQLLTLQNAGGGTIGFASISSPAPWLSVAPVPSYLGAGQLSTIQVTGDSGNLAAGTYQTNLTISSSNGNTVVPVTFQVKAAQ